MKAWLAFAATVACFGAALATDELPAAPDDEGQPLEIEPPVLIQNVRPDASAPDAQSNAPGDLDLARLEVDLERAKKTAAAGERLFKSGILAKIEVEERALRVVRIEAKVADARLQEAKRKLDELKAGSSSDEAFARELKAAETVVADATAAAAHAGATRRTAEVEAAARNVERQRKLLSLGSGRKADVDRAQEKLAQLQQPAN